MDTQQSSSSSPLPEPNKSNPNHRIKLNIGGKVFETTTSTLQSTITTSAQSKPIFIDRNPEIFSSLLSLLRTHHLPSTPFSTHQLLLESNFYGFNLSPFLSPPPFSPFDASFVTSLIPPSSPILSTFSAPSSPLNSPVLLAHCGQISCYDPFTLCFESATRAHVDDISSAASISPELFVIGSDSSPGVHVYGRRKGGHVGSVFWVDDSDARLQKSRVTSVADSGDGLTAVFSAAYECRHGENAVVVVDKETLKVVAEIGRQSGNSAKSSAIKRMRWVPRLGLLVGSSVNCGAFGYSGYVRVWDPRSGEMVWETSEPGGSVVVRGGRLGDTMADVDVDPEGLFLAKVGSRSGDLGVADLRKLGSDPWTYLEDPNPSFRGNWKAGCSVVVHCYEGSVVVGRDGELEAWSRMGREREVVVVAEEEEREWGLYRRNFVDKVEDSGRGVISKIEGGGNRLFVSREDVEGVEVWETSRSSGVKTSV